MLFNLVFTVLLALTSFDVRPVYKGGDRALATFIDRSLIYPAYSMANCIQGTVYVAFRLNREGKIYQSEVQKGFGTDLDDEALRIVRLTSGRWEVPTGYDTLLAVVLPVNFTLRDYKCEQRTRDEINAAISTYRAREGLTEAIYNFYDKKARGVYDRADEARILDLKAQLGYDEKFIDRLLRQAKRKLDQGDREGACEDFTLVKRLGSAKADGFLTNCSSPK